MPNLRVSIRSAVPLGAAGALAAVALFPTAPAAGAADTARFRMTLKGVQRTTWTQDLSWGGATACRGSGSEEVTFSTQKPLTMTVSARGRGRYQAVSHTFRRAYPPMSETFDVRATVTRQAQWTDTSACKENADATQTGRFRWRLWARGTMASDNWIVLDEWVGYGSPISRDPFPDVEISGRETFPSLLEQDDRGEYFGGRVSTKLLVRSRQKRFTVKAHGSSHRLDDRVSGITDTTDVRWTMTLTRIGSRGRR